MLAAKMLRAWFQPLLLAALLAAPRVGFAEPTQASRETKAAATEKPRAKDLEQARKHFETALTHYAEGRYRKAIIELRRAHALDPTGKDLLYNLAVVHEKLGEVGPALSYYRRVHELEKDGPERERIAATIRRLEGARDELIQTRLAETSAPAKDRAPPSEGTSEGSIMLVSAGVALVAIVASAVFGARALALSPGPADATGETRDVSDVHHDARAAHRSAIVADVSLLVGLISGGTASVLYLGRARSAERDPLDAHTAPAPPEAARVGLDLGIRF